MFSILLMFSNVETFFYQILTLTWNCFIKKIRFLWVQTKEIQSKLNSLNSDNSNSWIQKYVFIDFFTHSMDVGAILRCMLFLQVRITRSANIFALRMIRACKIVPTISNYRVLTVKRDSFVKKINFSLPFHTLLKYSTQHNQDLR